MVYEPRDKNFIEEYDEGYNHAKNGGEYNNPYEGVGYRPERETTIDYEREYNWYAGYYDFEPEDLNG